MAKRFGALVAGLLLGVMVAIPLAVWTQNKPKVTWPDVNWSKPDQKKPGPKRNIAGSWSTAGGPDAGTQAGGVQLKPNNGKPENDPPYTPHGLEMYKKAKPTEGINLVPPAEQNDPRNLCEPLGFPRWNHYSVRFTRIFQDDAKIEILYHWNNVWRTIWTDGRPLPKLVDGGVEIDGQFREARWMGYSVGKWLDDTTLEVQTVGTMPEERVWLDNTGRPVSDKVVTTERFRRVDYDTLEWLTSINDPVMYTRPWDTMKFTMRLQDINTDENENICSPALYREYNESFGNAISGK